MNLATGIGPPSNDPLRCGLNSNPSHTAAPVPLGTWGTAVLGKQAADRPGRRPGFIARGEMSVPMERMPWAWTRPEGSVLPGCTAAQWALQKVTCGQGLVHGLPISGF